MTSYSIAKRRKTASAFNNEAYNVPERAWAVTPRALARIADVVGERARTIADAARRLRCDQIVMSTARKNSLRIRGTFGDLPRLHFRFRQLE